MALNKTKIIDVKPVLWNNSDEKNFKTEKKLFGNNFVLDIILSTCVDSTAHGFGPIIRRDNLVIRIFWILCLIVSSIVCAWMIALSIMSYFDYETVSKTQNIHLTSTEFPAITICNINPFLTNESINFINDIFVKNGFMDPNDMTAFFFHLKATDYPYFRFFAATNALNPVLNDSYRKSLGPDISDMLFSCNFNLRECTANDFTWFFDTYFGNCFTFNSGKYSNESNQPIKISSKIGSINGLKIELYLYEPKSLSSLSLSSGARVVVHNQTHKPTFEEALLIPSGTEAFIEVNRMFTSLLQQPFSDCEGNIDQNHNSKFVKAILATGHAYTQLDCFNACYQSYLIEKCVCFDFTSLLPVETFTSQNITPCLNSTQLQCVGIVFVDFFTSRKETYCGIDCPLECNSVKYNSYSTYTDYPTKTYASAIVNNQFIRNKYASNLSELTYDSLKRNMLELSVFYGDLGYSEYEEVAKMEILDLISNIGGTLGLFLGMSFLSLVEIFDILLQVCFYNRCKTINNNISPSI